MCAEVQFSLSVCHELIKKTSISTFKTIVLLFTCTHEPQEERSKSMFEFGPGYGECAENREGSDLPQALKIYMRY